MAASPKVLFDAIWKSKYLLKVRAFLWLLTKYAILIWPNLQEREWMGPNLSALCKANRESSDHLMLSCNFISRIWTRCANIFHIPVDISAVNNLWIQRDTSEYQKSRRSNHCGLYLLKYTEGEK